MKFTTHNPLVHQCETACAFICRIVTILGKVSILYSFILVWCYDALCNRISDYLWSV